MNKLCLFSNGMAHFSRTYTLSETTKISIPFKNNHIGDVLSSFQLFGSVKYQVPPNFTPINDSQTSLDIDPSDVLRSLLSNLSGAEVSILNHLNQVICTGKLLGIDEIIGNVAGVNDVNYSQRVSVYTDGQIKRFRTSDVEVKFLSEAIQAEITKALLKNYEKVNPTNTLLNFTITPINEGATEIRLEYVVPVAAWKMRYSLRIKEGRAYLEGTVIIDNNTEEDWNDFKIVVVTGSPVSFQTDISEIRCPTRELVKLVADQAVKTMKVDRVFSASARSIRKSIPSNVNLMGFSACSENDYESCDAEYDTVGGSVLVGDEQFISEEIGDRVIFTNPDTLTIQSHKSAIVPMFFFEINDFNLVLIYKPNHSEKPYRAIRFLNRESVSLNRGKCTIYEEDILAGEVILENVKPSESQILPYAVETGVETYKDSKKIVEKVTYVSMRGGLLITKVTQTVETPYTIKNNKNEKFEFILEHKFDQNNPDMVRISTEVISEKLIPKGKRFDFELGPNTELGFSVFEESVLQNSLSISYQNQNLFYSTISSLGLLEDSPQGLPEIISKLDEIKQANNEIKKLEKQKQDLFEKGNRILANLQALKSENSTYEEWAKQLNYNERKIDDFKEKMDSAQAYLANLQKEIDELFKKLVFEKSL